MTSEKIIVDQVIEDLQHRPEFFECNAFELTDKKTKITYNVFYKIGVAEPYILKFSFWQRVRFIAALNKWKAADIIRRATE